MVDLNSKMTPAFTNQKEKQEMKNTSVFDVLLGIAIMVVGIFLFATSFTMQSIGRDSITENIFVISGESLGIVLCLIGGIFLYKLKK